MTEAIPGELGQNENMCEIPGDPAKTSRIAFNSHQEMGFLELPANSGGLIAPRMVGESLNCPNLFVAQQQLPKIFVMSN